MEQTNLIAKPKRMLFPDIVKAFAIILVVLGHNIQYGSGLDYFNNAFYFDNLVFKFIYSFHMPLFMLVSGYFFAFSVKKWKSLELVKSRIKALLVPIFAWSMIPIGVLFLKSILSHSLNFSFIKHSGGIVLRNLWFLWAILFCSFITLFVHKLCKDKLFIHIIILLILMFLPDVFNSSAYKFMYPYFIAGYYWNKNNIWDKVRANMLNRKFLYEIIFGLLFFVMLIFFNYNSYIYTTGIYLMNGKFINQFGIDIYRWCIGFAGSVFILWTLYIVCTKLEENHYKILQLISMIGVNSLGIYILDDVINNYIMLRVTKNFTGVNIIILVAETVIVTAITYFITILIKKSKLLNKVLLGAR